MEIKNVKQFLILDSNSQHNFHKLTKFQKIILIKLIRKEMLITSVQSFITETLGSKFVSPEVPTLQDLYNQTVPQSPIVFILSPGLEKNKQRS